jgi:hypothetical protein
MLKNPDKIRPMLLFLFSENYRDSFSNPLSPSKNSTWPVRMVAYQFAPYPNISAVFERVIGGPTSVPLDTITVVEPNDTDHNYGTIHFEVAPIIPVSCSIF